MIATLPKQPWSEDQRGWSSVKPRRIGVLLFEGFSLTECALTLETLQAANEILGEQLYCCTLASLSGHEVRSASDSTLVTSGEISRHNHFDELFVVGGRWEIALAGDAAAAQLRWFASRGTKISALSSAVGLLGYAGLLEGEPCAVAWPHQDVFREMFPLLSLTGQLFTYGRRVATCVGGNATLDFMAHRFAKEHGQSLAIAILDRFACDYSRPAETHHWAMYRRLFQAAGPGFARVAELMEENISEPLTCEALAKAARRSPRQMQRWFRQHIGYGPQTFYRNLRLMRALNLLRYSELGIAEIAVATGFCSHTNFSRNFRSHYGFRPRDVRRIRWGGLRQHASQLSNVPTLADAVRAQFA